jgi:hypothetical protein
MESIMQAALNMAAEYHTPVNYWVNIPLAEFSHWANAAKGMADERRRVSNQQKI